ncbi:ABC-type branched-chain amino acid transport system, substrate-binding protein [Lentzea fradiae]|uniref:ABC-type branched-chain amino acid transport system, substrate-binding protein n=1 Tax=Lentzea fradiae TaxID=200378 RepID=A0A1G7UG42_9PSEU|nr:ABC transporter substrate-binding protein [Lentzea fradiae]SDG46463.1 ABC-type branched-chain amino acid transport system, substrate-binding protein [Lentzea fradiae]
MPFLRRALPTTVALAVLVAGCGAKDDEKAQVETGPGVTDDTISLGILSDMTGPFKASSLTRIKGYELYLKQVNDRGGICGRKVELKQKDHAYDVQKALDGYFELEPQVLGLLEVAGAPMTAAIEPDIMQTRTLTAPASWSASLLGNPHMMIVGTTYDLDVINALDHYKRRGVIAEGDTVGHLYVQNNYGENAVEGSRFVGEQWNMKIAEQAVGETAADLTQQVAAMKAAGAKAVMLSTTPAQTAAAVGVAAALKWDVPFMANVVGWDTAILDSPVAAAVEKQLSVVTSVAPFSSDKPGARQVADAFTAAYPDEKPTIYVDHGYTVAKVFLAIVEKACKEFDLTRDGVLKAFQDTAGLETDGLTGPLRYSLVGRPSATQSYVTKVDASAPGGLTTVEDLFESELVKAKGTRAK